MKISYELDLSTFEAWSGAVSTLDRIQREGKCEELESLLEEVYPEGMTETELNDLLWFDDEWIFQSLGMRTESEIQSEIDEAEERIAEIEEEISDLMDDYRANYEDMTESECEEMWKSDYKDDIAALEEEKAELKDTIADLKEELEEI